MKKKTCLYFLDEMILPAARQVNLSRLKKRHVFLFINNGPLYTLACKVSEREVTPTKHLKVSQLAISRFLVKTSRNCFQVFKGLFYHLLRSKF